MLFTLWQKIININIIFHITINKIRFLLENINNDINVEITYYEPDSKKKGGHYIKHNGIIKKIIEYDKTIIFKDGKSIFIGNIIDLKY